MTTPPRVRVTSPRTGAAKVRRVAPRVEIDRRSRLGQVYLSSLVRSQLLLALGVLAVGVGTLVAMPLLFRFGGLADREVLGMPLSWVVLAFAVHPFLLACGWFYVRRAERNEEVFADLVEPLVTGSAREDRDDGEHAARDPDATPGLTGPARPAELPEPDR